MGVRRNTYVIRRPEQLAALGSPVRWRIVESLLVRGPSSVRELAARMNRRPEPLYYHVKALVETGLVLPQGERQRRRRSEAVYALVAPRLRIDRRQRSPAYLDALADSCAAMLRMATRHYRAAVERGGFALEGPARTLMVRRQTARLDRKGLMRLNRALDRLVELIDKQDDPGAGATYAVTIVLTELAASDRSH